MFQLTHFFSGKISILFITGKHKINYNRHIKKSNIYLGSLGGNKDPM